MPPATIKSEEIQKPLRSEEEIMLDFLLESIMGFPPDAEEKQALTNAGVRSIMDIFTMEVDLFSQLTYNAGTERESLRLLDVSKLRKLAPSMTHCVIVKTSLRSRTTSGQPWTPKTGVNIVSTPKVLEESLNHQQL